MSRIGPVWVNPVEIRRPASRADLQWRARGPGPENGVEVIPIATGHRVAVIKAYPVTFDPRMEADMPDVFFRRMTLDAFGRQLLVENEHSLCVHVAIDGHAVTSAP